MTCWGMTKDNANILFNRLMNRHSCPYGKVSLAMVLKPVRAMDAMFIDEGFGTLDDNALRNSLQVLSDLADGKRLIGIISHVHDLEERIDKQIIVSKTLRGSKIVMNR